jgi:RNA polymerase sigma-70 factor (sigma-E family)
MVIAVGADPVPITEGGLDALYVEHAPAALRLALLLTGDRALAEDLVQDAFVRVAARRSHLRDPDAFGAYLRRAVANGAKSHFRHVAVVRRTDATRPPVPSSDLHAQVDLRSLLWDALLTLPDRQRAAIVLRYYADLPEREVASVLRCRPGTVKSLLSRGLDALRKVVPDE